MPNSLLPRRCRQSFPRRGRRRALSRCSRNGFTYDRNEVGRCRCCRFPGRARQVLAHRTSPAEQLLRTDLPPARPLAFAKEALDRAEAFFAWAEDQVMSRLTERLRAVLQRCKEFDFEHLATPADAK
jgi:hypothetical protein